MSLSIRGLNIFISDLRNCPNKEAEVKRVEIEKQKIRQKFAGKSTINGYDRKKYIWKLIYIKLLGHEVDFGYKEAAMLINSQKHSEKYTGYVATSQLVPEIEEEIYKGLLPSIKNDLQSSNDFFQSLALSMLGNQANKVLSAAMIQPVYTIALGESSKISNYVRKKALLTLLRIFRKYQNNFENTTDMVEPIHIMLQQNEKLGFISSALSFILGIASLKPDTAWDVCVGPVVDVQHKLVCEQNCPPDYRYYGIPCPWVQIKALKILSLLNVPKDSRITNKINGILEIVLASAGVTEDENKNNTIYAILFEALGVIIHYRKTISFDLQNQALSLVILFMGVPEPNIRYLALESMTRILVLPEADEALSEQLRAIIESLSDKDVSIRRRSLDLLYLMCNYNNVGKIVEEMLNFSEETDMQIKEELVLKIAILSEKFAPNLTWYIDVIIRLLSKSGDYITDDIWWRVIQIITGFGNENNQTLQKYAASSLQNALSLPNVHESLVRVASYVIAEFGHQILDHSSLTSQYECIQKHFEDLSPQGKAMILSAYVKMANKHKNADFTGHISAQFLGFHDNWDCELQTRAVEYNRLLDGTIEAEISDHCLQAMPHFPMAIQEDNLLLTKLIKLKAGVAGEKKKTEDPTITNEAKKLMDTAQEIYHARETSKKTGNATKGIKYDDLFIESEHAYIKFLEFPVWEMCKDKLALSGENIMLTPENFPVPKTGFREFKNTLLHDDGIIFQDQMLKIEYKSMYKGPEVKIAIQFVSTSGNLTIRRANIEQIEGLKMTMSPIKVAEHPQLMMTGVCTGIVNKPPVIMMKYTQNAQERSLEFCLPIFIHKFLNPLALEESKHRAFWHEYSTTNNASMFKLDEFIPNPAGPGVPINEVMNKIGSLLGGGLRIKANAWPNQENCKQVWGSAQYCYKPEGEIVQLPFLIEAEGYEEFPEHIRLGIRAGGSPFIAQSFFQILLLFLQT